MAADRQTDIHTTSANVVTLVWGSLRLAPMNMKMAGSHYDARAHPHTNSMILEGENFRE